MWEIIGNMIPESVRTVVAIGFSVAIATAAIWQTHKWNGHKHDLKTHGAFFTLVEDYPAITIFSHKSGLRGKNPLPLSSPEGIYEDYYFLAVFDREGKDYLGQVPPEIFEKLYAKGYDIDNYTVSELVGIFRELRANTDTLHTEPRPHASEGYFQGKIAFAREQLKQL